MAHCGSISPVGALANSLMPLPCLPLMRSSPAKYKYEPYQILELEQEPSLLGIVVVSVTPEWSEQSRFGECPHYPSRTLYLRLQTLEFGCNLVWWTAAPVNPCGVRCAPHGLPCLHCIDSVGHRCEFVGSRLHAVTQVLRLPSNEARSLQIVVESSRSAPGMASGSSYLPTDVARRRVLSLTHSGVSSSRSLNRTCGFPIRHVARYIIWPILFTEPLVPPRHHLSSLEGRRSVSRHERGLAPELQVRTEAPAILWSSRLQLEGTMRPRLG